MRYLGWLHFNFIWFYNFTNKLRWSNFYISEGGLVLIFSLCLKDVMIDMFNILIFCLSKHLNVCFTLHIFSIVASRSRHRYVLIAYKIIFDIGFVQFSVHFFNLENVILDLSTFDIDTGVFDSSFWIWHIKAVLINLSYGWLKLWDQTKLDLRILCFLSILKVRLFGFFLFDLTFKMMHLNFIIIIRVYKDVETVQVIWMT